MSATITELQHQQQGQLPNRGERRRMQRSESKRLKKEEKKLMKSAPNGGNYNPKKKYPSSHKIAPYNSNVGLTIKKEADPVVLVQEPIRRKSTEVTPIININMKQEEPVAQLEQVELAATLEEIINKPIEEEKKQEEEEPVVIETTPIVSEDNKNEQQEQINSSGIYKTVCENDIIAAVATDADNDNNNNAPSSLGIQDETSVKDVTNQEKPVEEEQKKLATAEEEDLSAKAEETLPVMKKEEEEEKITSSSGDLLPTPSVSEKTGSSTTTSTAATSHTTLSKTKKKNIIARLIKQANKAVDNKTNNSDKLIKTEAADETSTEKKKVKAWKIWKKL